MNFEEFKKKYAARLIDAVAMPTDEELAKIFIGLVVFTEWQKEENEKQLRAAAKALKSDRSVLQ